MDSKSQIQLERSINRINKQGLRITKPRQAILEVLIRERCPLCIEALYRKIKKGTCSRMTAYRSLPILEKAGLVNRCDFGDGRFEYELRDDNRCRHHHIVCRICRKIKPVQISFLKQLEKFISKEGYDQVSYSMGFFGVCKKCQRKASH